MNDHQSNLFGSTAPDRPKFILREYQRAGVDKVKWALKMPGNDLLVYPTGAGKSLIIAALADELAREVLILQPSKEILEQNHSKLRQYIPDDRIGIFSASMNRKDTNDITLATIQSVYKYPELFQNVGLIIIDECDLVNIKNDSGMYMEFIAAIGNPKTIGLTATPYRLEPCYIREKGYGGYDDLICQVGIKLINRVKPPKPGDKTFRWNRLLFNINNKELVDQGYLTPLKYESINLMNQEDIPLNKSKSDFDLEAYEEKIKGRYKDVLEKIRELMPIHKSILVFNASIKQAMDMHQAVSDIQMASAVVTGKTPVKERERIINGFKDGSIQIVFNVGVLTTGFDHPALDCILLNRPTRSIRLYYQIAGRGVRLFPGKEFCRFVDFTNTVEQIGPIESLELVKVVDPDEIPYMPGKPVTAKWNLKSATGLWHGKILYRWTKEIKSKAAPSAPGSGSDSFDDIFGTPNNDIFGRHNDLEF